MMIDSSNSAPRGEGHEHRDDRGRHRGPAGCGEGRP